MGEEKMSKGIAVRERSSNVELLRIICMLLIIMHHFVVHGGSAGIPGISSVKIISIFVRPLGKICFNTFVAISTWFLVSSRFKMSRFMKVWLEVLFYNIVMMGITTLYCTDLGYEISWRNWLGAAFPIIGNSHGYASAYIAFYLIIPALKLVGDRISKGQLVVLIFVLLITQCGSPLLGSFIGYTQPHNSEILLFVMCYFISLYLQKYPMSWQNNKVVLFMAFFGIWLLIFGLTVYDTVSPGSGLVYYLLYVAMNNEFSVFNIAAGYALFLLFYNISFPPVRIINRTATTTFGILLMHDHNYFRPVLWYIFVKANLFYEVSGRKFVLIMGVVTVAIFVLGMIIDLLRQNVLEKLLMNSRAMAVVCEKVDNFYAKEN